MSEAQVREISLLVNLESFVERAMYDLEALESEADRNRRIAYWSILTGKTAPLTAAAPKGPLRV